MNLKKRLLKKSLLYCIIDKETLHNKSPFEAVSQIKKSKIPCIIQYRDKVSKKEEIIETAFGLRKLLLDTNIVFIVNDYLDAAKISNADGLHIGQEDISIKTARRIMGKDKIIGVSTHNLKQASTAQRQRADYIGIGPVFITSIKPEYKPISRNVIKEVKQKITIPFFAIGGISETNIKQVLNYGANKIAICKAICQTKDICNTIKTINYRLSSIN